MTETTWTEREKSVPRTFRLPRSLDESLSDRAYSEERPKTAIVIDSLTAYLSSREPSKDGGAEGDTDATIPTPHQGAPGADGNVDFGAWLQWHVGLPRAIVRQKLGAGKVTVGGEPHTEITINADALAGEIVFDGETVVSA